MKKSTIHILASASSDKALCGVDNWGYALCSVGFDQYYMERYNPCEVCRERFHLLQLQNTDL